MDNIAIAMHDPALRVIIECAINILLAEQCHEKAVSAAGIHSTEAKAKALRAVEKLAEDGTYQDIAAKIAAILREEGSQA